MQYRLDILKLFRPLKMCIEDYSKPSTYEERLLTFVGWPKALSPSLLAKSGFYYTKEKDIVQCFHCNIEMHNWNAMDDPLSDHLRDSPTCAFAKLLTMSLTNETHRLSLTEKQKYTECNEKSIFRRAVQHVLENNLLLYFTLTMNMLNIIMLLKQ